MTPRSTEPLVRPQTLFLVLLTVILLLLVAGSARTLARYCWDTGWQSSLGSLVNLGGEHTVPAWFSSVQLALAGCLTILVFLDRRNSSDRLTFFWLVLGITMIYLSLDEAVSLHERLSLPLRARFGFGGVLYYAWLIPGGVLTAVFAVGSLPFLRALPRRTASLLVISGAVFVIGAIGIEMAEGWLADSGANRTLVFEICVVVEEGLEMLGIALFIFGVSEYCRDHCPTLGRLFRGRSEE